MLLPVLAGSLPVRSVLPLLAGGWLIAAGPSCHHDPAVADNATLTVLAASSLTDAFTALASQYEDAHPGVAVALTFAGSQVLRTQLELGRKADLFASANRPHMEGLREAGLVSDAVVIARGSLVLIVPADKPTAIEHFGQLDRVRRLIIGNSAVPIGAYTRDLLRGVAGRLGPDYVRRVRERVVSEEASARLLTAKVAMGAADGAIVYATDALATENVRSIAVPDEHRVQVEYLLAHVRPAPGRLHARQFMAFVRSAAGQRTLVSFGFEGRKP